MTPDQSSSGHAPKERPHRTYKRDQEIISRRKIYRTTARRKFLPAPVMLF